MNDRRTAIRRRNLRHRPLLENPEYGDWDEEDLLVGTTVRESDPLPEVRQ